MDHRPGKLIRNKRDRIVHHHFHIFFVCSLDVKVFPDPCTHKNVCAADQRSNDLRHEHCRNTQTHNCNKEDIQHDHHECRDKVACRIDRVVSQTSCNSSSSLQENGCKHIDQQEPLIIDCDKGMHQQKNNDISNKYHYGFQNDRRRYFSQSMLIIPAGNEKAKYRLTHLQTNHDRNE